MYSVDAQSVLNTQCNRLTSSDFIPVFFFFVQENTKLYLNLLEMEYCGDLTQNEENILSCFDKAVNGSLSIKMRVTFSQRKVEFLEDFGSDVNK